MVKFDRRVGIAAVLLGGLAWLVPMFVSGTTTLGSGMGGYGGAMGGHGGMMGGYGGMMGGYGGLGIGWTTIGIISQLGFFLVLLGGAYLLYRAFASHEEINLSGPEDSALTELRIAYARGDISGEEFDTRHERLRVDEAE